jgi:hypothetical protein
MSVTREIPGSFELIRVPSLLPKQAFAHRATPHLGTRDTAAEWLAIAERVAQRVELDASAHAHGAMLRRRGVPTATRLLCLALLSGPGRMPLRLITEQAHHSDIAHVSEPALLRRLTNAAPWLAHLADTMMRNELTRQGEPETSSKRLPQPVIDRHHSQREAELARAFILDFQPWPVDAFTERQVHWLLCVRWNYVAATLRDGAGHRAPAEAQASPMELTRRWAHLIVAML